MFTEYQISWRVAYTNNTFMNRTVGANKRRQTVTGLDPQLYYEFKVTGRTQKGWGETATVEVYTMSNRSES